MKIGKKIIAIRDYTFGGDSNLSIKSGDILTVDCFSKKDWSRVRYFPTDTNEGNWFLSFKEIPGEVWLFPNHYMKICKRLENLEILLT